MLGLTARPSAGIPDLYTELSTGSFNNCAQSCVSESLYKSHVRKFIHDRAPDMNPVVTVGILSWNRLHYLRATLESARRCIHYPNIEWIVVDNMSEEPGLREYLDKQNWIDHVVYKRQTHAQAMNQIVDMATGEYLVLWPEDVQFVVEGEWMTELVDILRANDDIGSVCLDYMRKVTIEKLFHPKLLSNWRLLKTSR